MIHTHLTERFQPEKTGWPHPAYLWEWSQECAALYTVLAGICFLLADTNPCRGATKQHRQAWSSVRSGVVALFNLVVQTQPLIPRVQQDSWKGQCIYMASENIQRNGKNISKAKKIKNLNQNQIFGTDKVLSSSGIRLHRVSGILPSSMWYCGILGRGYWA